MYFKEINKNIHQNIPHNYSQYLLQKYSTINFLFLNYLITLLHPTLFLDKCFNAMCKGTKMIKLLLTK